MVLGTPWDKPARRKGQHVEHETMNSVVVLGKDKLKRFRKKMGTAVVGIWLVFRRVGFCTTFGASPWDRLPGRGGGGSALRRGRSPHPPPPGPSAPGLSLKPRQWRELRKS